MRQRFVRYPIILTAILTALLVMLAGVFPALAQLDLSETYTSPDGSITLKYPAGWVVQSDLGGVRGGSSEAAMEIDPANMNVEQIQFIVAALTEEDLAGVHIATLEDVIQVLIDQMDSPQEEISFGEITSTLINDRPLAYLQATNGKIEALIIAVESNGGYLALVSATVPDGIASFQSTLLNMAATIEYDAAAAAAGSTDGFSSQLDPAQIPAPVAGTDGQMIWQQQTRSAPAPDAFGNFINLTVGPDDAIYVADSYNGVITFSSDGAALAVSHNTNIFHAADVALGADNTLWIADDYQAQIFQIDAGGNILQQFGQAGSDLGQFGSISPQQFEIGLDGSLYVLDISETTSGAPYSRIEVFAPDGSYLREFNITQEGDVGFTYGIKMAFAPDGRLFVGDFFGTLRIFDSEGTVLADNFAYDVLEFKSIGGIAVDEAGFVYVATDQGIYKFAPDGTQVAQYGVKQVEAGAFEPGQFYGPTGIGLLSNGDVVVIDSNYAFSQVVRLVLE